MKNCATCMEVVNSATGWIIRVTLREPVGGGRELISPTRATQGRPMDPPGAWCRGSLVIAFKVACNAAENKRQSDMERRLVPKRFFDRMGM